MTLSPQFSQFSNSIKSITKMIFDRLLAGLSFLLGLLTFFAADMAFFWTRPAPPIFLFWLGILLFLLNLLAWAAWKSWNMRVFGCSLFVVSALLFIILGIFFLPNPYMVENPLHLAIGTAADLILLYICTLWSAHKRPILGRILLIEFTALGLLAAVPLYTVCTGKVIVLRTKPLGRADQDRIDCYHSRELLPTVYDIQSLPAAGKSYRDGESVYVILNKRQDIWSVKSLSKSSPKVHGDCEVALKAQIDPPNLYYDCHLPDVLLALLPETYKGKRRPYLVTLTLNSFGPPIVRAIKPE